MKKTLVLVLPALSSCLQPEAVKVDLSPVLDAVATLEAKVDAVVTMDAELSVDAIAAAVVSKQESEAKARDVGGDQAGRDVKKPQFGGKNDNLTTWLGMASGPVCLIYYLWIHRPIRRKLQNGKGPQ